MEVQTAIPWGLGPLIIAALAWRSAKPRAKPLQDHCSPRPESGRRSAPAAGAARGSVHVEEVPQARDRLDGATGRARHPELPAQLADRGAERPDVVPVVGAPHRREELAVAEDRVRMNGHLAQDAPLVAGEPHWLPPPPHDPMLDVD